MPDDEDQDLVKVVASRLAALRREQGITQEVLAERLGTAVENLKRIERGQNLTLRTLQRIAIALGVIVKIDFESDPRGPRTPPPGRA